MRIRNIFGRILGGALSVAIIASAAVQSACTKDKADGYEGAAYLRLENTTINKTMKDFVVEATDAGFTAKPIIGNDVSELVTYDIRSNRDWRVVVENPATDSWVKIYPGDGELDGRIRFVLDDNDNLTARQANVLFYYSNGTLAEPMLTIRQEANVEHINVYVNNKEATRAAATTDASEFAIRISANVPYYYKVETDYTEKWFTFTETARDTFKLSVDKFESDGGKREGYITFYGAGEHSAIVTKLRVMQSAFNADNATTVGTVEELLQMRDASGMITENCSITGVVISDIDSKNVPANTVVVECGNSGLCLHLTAENTTLKAGTQVKLWLYEAVVTDDLIVKNVVANDRIFDPQAVAMPAPVEVTSLADAKKYCNRYVTLKGAEWVFPYGTYYPGDENNCYKPKAAYGSADHSRLVRLAGGGAIRAYVVGGTKIEDGPEFKHAQLLPNGSGDLTGIIMPRHTETSFSAAEKAFTEFVPVFRMSKVKDDQISKDGVRSWSNVVEFVWHDTFGEEKAGKYPIVPNSGAGTLKTTFGDQWDFDGGALYAGYNYWRELYDKQAIAPDAYIGLNGRGPWNAHDGSTGSSYVDDLKGEAWICTVSTADVTASEELGVFFATSSSASGPRDFAIEWSTSETGTFQHVANYEVTNWDALYYPLEFYFPLPDECRGLETLVVRCRVYSARRADLTSTSNFGGSGTNRMCAFAIAKRTK